MNDPRMIAVIFLAGMLAGFRLAIWGCGVVVKEMKERVERMKVERTVDNGTI